jgi:hypothetical protein
MGLSFPEEMGDEAFGDVVLLKNSVHEKIIPLGQGHRKKGLKREYKPSDLL